MARTKGGKAKKRAKARKPARKATKKAAPKKAAPRRAAPRAAAAPNPWKAYADDLAREMQTTLRVMRAFPTEQSGFQPHPRSGSAMQLFHTFGVEQNVALMAVNGTLDLGKAFSVPAPPSLSDAIASFERNAAAVVASARGAKPEAWNRLQPFFTGPQKMGQLPAGIIASMMLSDQIHHRGQLSVYVRMAGGKVPSIYGPSADEPW